MNERREKESKTNHSRCCTVLSFWCAFMSMCVFFFFFDAFKCIPICCVSARKQNKKPINNFFLSPFLFVVLCLLLLYCVDLRDDLCCNYLIVGWFYTKQKSLFFWHTNKQNISFSVACICMLFGFFYVWYLERRVFNTHAHTCRKRIKIFFTTTLFFVWTKRRRNGLDWLGGNVYISSPTI